MVRLGANRHVAEFLAANPEQQRAPEGAAALEALRRAQYDKGGGIPLAGKLGGSGGIGLYDEARCGCAAPRRDALPCGATRCDALQRDALRCDALSFNFGQ